MSQILLYISLIITSSASAGAVAGLSYEGNVENAVFTSVYEKSDALQMLSGFDDNIDVLANEVDNFTSIIPGNKSLPFSYVLALKSQFNSANIRAPPAIS